METYLTPPMSRTNRYSKIIEAIFDAKYRSGSRDVAFERDDLAAFASKLNIKLPKNLGDLIYSFRYRTELPESILEVAPEGETWIIRPAGRGRYRFVLVADVPLTPNPESRGHKDTRCYSGHNLQVRL